MPTFGWPRLGGATVVVFVVVLKHGLNANAKERRPQAAKKPAWEPMFPQEVVSGAQSLNGSAGVYIASGDNAGGGRRPVA